MGRSLNGLLPQRQQHLHRGRDILALVEERDPQKLWIGLCIESGIRQFSQSVVLTHSREHRSKEA